MIQLDVTRIDRDSRPDSVGVLTFADDAISYVVTVDQSSIGWHWPDSRVTFDSEGGRRVSVSDIAAIGVLGLVRRPKVFRVVVDSPVGAAMFQIVGDLLTRDVLAKRIVDMIPSAAGRVTVGSQVIL